MAELSNEYIRKYISVRKATESGTREWRGTGARVRKCVDDWIGKRQNALYATLSNSACIVRKERKLRVIKEAAKMLTKIKKMIRKIA